MHYATWWQPRIFEYHEQSTWVIKTCIVLYDYINKQRQYEEFGRDHEVSQDCFFVYSTNIELFHPQLGPVVHFLRC